MKIVGLMLTFFAAMFSQCEKDPADSTIIKIEFGTSFGMCAGYCEQIVAISDGVANKTLTPRSDPSLTEKSCNTSFDLNALTNKIDLTTFYVLEETIGCPDCADGGAEWIEITTEEGAHKVTYEFRKEPEAVRSFIADLREVYHELGNCD